MLKVVIDTNVFISGVLYGGTPRQLLTLWISKKYIFCISPELKAEILIKLNKKFHLSSTTLSNIEEALDTYSRKYIPKQKVALCKDPQDNFLLELAQEARADYIVSGDKLVLELRQHNNTKIISPREFITYIT